MLLERLFFLFFYFELCTLIKGKCSDQFFIVTMLRLREKVVYLETLRHLRHYLFRRLARENMESSTTLELEVTRNPASQKTIDAFDSLCFEMETNYLRSSGDILGPLLNVPNERIQSQMQNCLTSLFLDGYSWGKIICLFAAIGVQVAKSEENRRQYLAYELSFQVAKFFASDAIRMETFLQKHPGRWEALLCHYDMNRPKNTINYLTVGAIGVFCVAALLVIKYR